MRLVFHTVETFSLALFQHVFHGHFRHKLKQSFRTRNCSTPTIKNTTFRKVLKYIFWSEKVFVSQGRVSGLQEKGADLRGSPGNFRGSPGNFRGSDSGKLPGNLWIAVKFHSERTSGNFRGSLGPQFNPLLPHFLPHFGRLLTSFFGFNLTSARFEISNHGLKPTVYIPLVLGTQNLFRITHESSQGNYWSRGSAGWIWVEFFWGVWGILEDCPQNFLSELFQRIYPQIFRPCFPRASGPPSKKLTYKIHAQNCRHSSPISDVWIQTFFTQPAPKYHTKGCSHSSRWQPGSANTGFCSTWAISSCEFRASIAWTPFSAILWRSPI